MRYGINIEELARRVAADLKKAMDEQGFETFNQMRECYWWEPSDIRDEIAGTAQCILNDEVEKDEDEFGSWENIPYTVRCYVDDYGHISYSDQEVKYGQFKKMVLSQI